MIAELFYFNGKTEAVWFMPNAVVGNVAGRCRNYRSRA